MHEMDLSEALAQDVECQLYEGLPHQYWLPEQLAEERRMNRTIKMDGFSFYAAPVKINVTDISAIRDLLAKDSTFEQLSEGKLCGGYHPDFAIVWNRAGQDLTTHFCFGCGEAKVYYGYSWAHCDLSNAGYQELMKLLKPYHKHLPEPPP